MRRRVAPSEGEHLRSPVPTRIQERDSNAIREDRLLNRFSLILLPEVVPETRVVAYDPNLGRPGFRSTEDPCEYFQPGEPSGDCYTDGHYLCIECDQLSKNSQYFLDNQPQSFVINKATLVKAVIAAWVLSRPEPYQDVPLVGIWEAVGEVFEQGAFPAWRNLLHFEDGHYIEDTDLASYLEEYQRDLSYATAQVRARQVNLPIEVLEDWGWQIRYSEAVYKAISQKLDEIRAQQLELMQKQDNARRRINQFRLQVEAVAQTWLDVRPGPSQQAQDVASPDTSQDPPTR